MGENVLSEIERITNLLKDFGLSENRIKILEPVIENTAFMKMKLDEAKDLLDRSSIVISYDNGGGQKGIRENPIFKGYESLWKSYMQGMKQIIDSIPEEHAEAKEKEMEKPRTMLEVVRARKQA